MKTIAVTGATSMIGTALIDTAVRDGIEVYAIIRPQTKRLERLPKSSQVHILFSELNQLLSIEDIPCDCDSFYHLAWAGTVRSERDDPRIHENNIRYTLDAVELAARMGCNRFIGAGSQAEYGPVNGIINDDTKYAPTTSYGIAKLASYMLSQKRCSQLGLEHVWGRIFSVYGPHDNEGTMLNTAIDDFINGRTASFSAATQMWNYLYESDAGELFLRMSNETVKQGLYFVANPESRILKEYIQVMIAQFEEEVKFVFAERKRDIYGLEVDMGKTCCELDYIPRVSFSNGIKRTILARKITNEQDSGRKGSVVAG